MKMLVFTLLVLTLCGPAYSASIFEDILDTACEAAVDIATVPACTARGADVEQKMKEYIGDPERRQCCALTYVVECMRDALYKACGRVDDSTLIRLTSSLRSQPCRAQADPLGLVVCLPDGLYQCVVIAGLIFLASLVCSLAGCVVKAMRLC